MSILSQKYESVAMEHLAWCPAEINGITDFELQ